MELTFQHKEKGFNTRAHNNSAINWKENQGRIMGTERDKRIVIAEKVFENAI